MTPKTKRHAENVVAGALVLDESAVLKLLKLGLRLDTETEYFNYRAGVQALVAALCDADPDNKGVMNIKIGKQRAS